MFAAIAALAYADEEFAAYRPEGADAASETVAAPAASATGLR